MESIQRHQEAGKPEKKGKFRRVTGEIFGQFTKPEFWRELAKTLVHEMVTTFFMAFGGAIYWYGKKQRNSNKDSVVPPDATSGGGMSERAFGGSSGFSSDYRPSTHFPVKPNPAGDSRFPGFN